MVTLNVTNRYVSNKTQYAPTCYLRSMRVFSTTFLLTKSPRFLARCSVAIDKPEAAARVRNVLL